MSAILVFKTPCVAQRGEDDLVFEMEARRVPKKIKNQLVKISKIVISILLIHLSCFNVEVSANSSGAPNWTCKFMKPGHGRQQPEPSPFSIQVSPKVITPGSPITIILKSVPGKTFKGFLVTAFRTTGTGPRLDNLIGTFQGPANARITCHGKGITHRNSIPKANIVLNWTPPNTLTNTDRLVFNVTFVEQHAKYWRGISTEELTAANFPNQPSPRPVTQPTTGATKTSSMGPQDTFLKEDEQCGKEHSCFHDCFNGRCSFTVSWKDAGDSIAFHLKMMPVAIRERWIAVGFSQDVLMGDDSVTECMVDRKGAVKVYNSYNDAKTNHRLDDKVAGLSKMEGSFVNGQLDCRFHRNKTSRYDPKMFDLNEHWFMMFSDGDALAGDKLPHRFDKLPSVTSNKVNLLFLGSMGAAAAQASPLVKAHGCLMTIAWMLLTSIGIVTARYGKPLWPAHTLFGLKIWFQIHRTAMVSTMGLTLFSFVLILIEVKGISIIPDVTGKQYWQLHPWFGFMIVVLSMSNPFMALFRPGAGAPGRIVFNWMHWGVGVFSVFLAVITIFIGLDLPKSGASMSSLYVMAFAVIYLVFMFLLMESIPCILKKVAVKKTYELNPRNSTYVLTRQESQVSTVTNSPSPNKEKEIRVRTIVITCHYVIATITSIVLIILVVV
ncbi:ferric-chelate reductase 1-like [Gigantopelta aegis]|uniref:ferric-chelate reductase 1-like n=1 Tax=Gigantopelta aegis TaxID=1735272 RepID=UPI001B889FE3|nr:ferric-chelate reductase 1-like [Gigantopelta aegis]